MKKLFISFLLICIYSVTYAQNLTVKSVNLSPLDSRASRNPRDDGKGNQCAIIRIGVVGVDNLVFPDAVGNVERHLSEYVVYVPAGLKTFKYRNNAGKELGTIIFDEYGLEIEAKHVYNVIFGQLRSAIFSIQPVHATLFFDGKKVEVNSDGIAMINKPVGNYSYTVEAKGYIGQEGIVSLEEDDISTVTDIFLEEQLYPVTINVFPENATVFIDNVPYTNEALSDLQLPDGKHNIRITATDYQDKEETITVNSSTTSFVFSLKKVKQEIILHKEERTRTSINIRNAIYIVGGFAMNAASDIGKLFGSNNAYDFGVELSAVQHFGGLFALREGISLGILKSNKNEKYIDLAYDSETDSLCLLPRIDVPLQLGISVPFGLYNQHLFSAFGGGYARVIWHSDWKETEYKPDENNAKKSDVDDYMFDYGIRLSAKLDLGHFTIGVDFSQSFNDLGFSAGVNLGVKLYLFKKKKY